ncbi:hypothetical protein FH972_024676 [Carpinus fangiana]|uniref:Glyoxalase-like domain-containing protein n=1 Tax=Carpinus fangiana TaxID=176857 RepID=A0A5N6L179_9ROSI|nr:hypothetical protein FH972_024676 [Carpinus fangiana]
MPEYPSHLPLFPTYQSQSRQPLRSTTMPGPTPQLDHIIIHLPLEQLDSPPKWLTDAFTISPGGTHGDGKTTNKLIVFADGTYIELLAFTSPAARVDHWWGDKGYGIVDYAFTLPAAGPGVAGADAGAQGYEHIRTRLDAAQPALAAVGRAGLLPSALRSGSRAKPDGDRIEWHVAFPLPECRGRAPFWCFDVTPRERRVPVDKAATTHPSGALAVGSLSVFVADEGGEERAALLQVLDASVPFDAGPDGVEVRLDESTWELATPRKIESHVPCQLFVVGAREGSGEMAALRDRGRGLAARLTLFTGPGAGERGRIQERVGEEGDEVFIGFTANM